MSLLVAAREASKLTNQLLSFERAGGTDVAQAGEVLDFKELVVRVVDTFRIQNSTKDIEVLVDAPDAAIHIRDDSVMLQEAILNLLTKSVVHGGPKMSKIMLCMTCLEDKAKLLIKDNGVEIPPNKHIAASSRFGQANGSLGSGLGLPIAARVVKNHGGSLEIIASTGGACIL